MCALTTAAFRLYFTPHKLQRRFTLKVAPSNIQGPFHLKSVSQKSLRMILTEPLAKFIDYGNAVFEGDKKSGNPTMVSIALLPQLRMDRRAKDSANEILLDKMVGNSFERLCYPVMWGLYIVNYGQPVQRKVRGFFSCLISLFD